METFSDFYFAYFMVKMSKMSKIEVFFNNNSRSKHAKFFFGFFATMGTVNRHTCEVSAFGVHHSSREWAQKKKEDDTFCTRNIMFLVISFQPLGIF
jgi:hypothetical protein